MLPGPSFFRKGGRTWAKPLTLDGVRRNTATRIRNARCGNTDEDQKAAAILQLRGPKGTDADGICACRTDTGANRAAEALVTV